MESYSCTKEQYCSASIEERRGLFYGFLISLHKAPSTAKQYANTVPNNVQVSNIIRRVCSKESLYGVISIRHIETILEHVSELGSNKSGHNSLSSSIKLYKEFLIKLGVNDSSEDNPHNTIMSSMASKKTTKMLDYPYRKYITAIKTKPFLLLAGISGTGKSRLARELARACWDEGSDEYNAHKPKNFEMIQVKPNWHDSSELIGYTSRINGEKYIVGPFLKFMAKAIQDPDIPYILCLDEMNLAPVEQYFAEYLSVIESRKVQEGIIVTDPLIDYDKSESYASLITQLFPENLQKAYLSPVDESQRRFLFIPQNLIVIGTVNMDESTYSFSRKVLDRAMSIEMMDVDLNSGLTTRHEPIGKINYSDLIGGTVEGVDVYEKNAALCDKTINYLIEINTVLENTPFKIAYRTRNESLLYVVNNQLFNKDKEGSTLDESIVLARSLDEITSMKILSRIEGDESRVNKNLLDNLSTTISRLLTSISGEVFSAEQTDSTTLSVSMAKLEEMKSRLESGYTSFWS